MKRFYLLVLPILICSCMEVDENDRLPDWDEVVIDMEIPEEDRSIIVDSTDLLMDSL